MNESTQQNEILVCGHAAAARIEDLLPVLGGGLALRGAHTKQELLTELAKGQQPICVIEHLVPIGSPTMQMARLFAGLFGKNSATAEDSRWAEEFLTQRAFSLPPGITAYDLLPELVARGPRTRFVITSHTRGEGLSPRQRALYKERKEVLKVMGFVNSLQNSQYLMKLFSRVYLGKAWKA